MNVCTEQNQGILPKTHRGYQHSLPLILGCSAKSTPALLGFLSRDHSSCQPGTQRGMCGEHPYCLFYCLLLFSCLQGNILHSQQTAMNEKEPLCIAKLIHISYSHDITCSAGSYLPFEKKFNSFFTSFFDQADPIAQSNICLQILPPFAQQSSTNLLRPFSSNFNIYQGLKQRDARFAGGYTTRTTCPPHKKC